MKPQCTTAAQCLKELARVMEQFGIKSTYGALNSKYVVTKCEYNVFPDFTTPSNWQFALAEVEGKPVFIGDELFDADGIHATVTGFDGQLFEVEIPKGKYVTTRKSLTWNPPKPATVMVELTVEDANCWSNLIECGIAHNPSARLYEACKTALEKLK